VEERGEPNRKRGEEGQSRVGRKRKGRELNSGGKG
jgi:hypothetical protein